MKSTTSILFLFLIVGCQQNITNSNVAENFCDNELLLISELDTIPSIYINLLDFNNNIYDLMIMSFDNLDLSQDIHFNINLKLDTKDSIKVAFRNYFHPKNTPLTELVTIHHETLILTDDGKVFFGPELICLDSLKSEVYNHYSQIGDSQYYLSSEMANLTILWDQNVNENDFNKLINGIINGYLQFMNESCIKTFNKELCSISPIELNSLAKEIPFYIRLCDSEIIDESDCINKNDSIEEFDFDD